MTKRTAQNLFLRSGKFEAEVTNNRRFARCNVLLTLTTYLLIIKGGTSYSDVVIYVQQSEGRF